MTARVLVVDDSQGSVLLLNAHLRYEYLEVITANNGEEALTEVARSEPDLIVLDLLMDGMDGFEVCRRVKSNPATTHVPILILSSLDTPADRARALDAGADAYLTKPVRPLPFIARVRSLIQSKRVIDELRLSDRAAHESRLEPKRSATVLDVDTCDSQVLLISPDRAAMTQIRSSLESQHAVHVDQDPEDGLLVVQRGEFDVIVVDFALPEALRLCSRLRTSEKTRRIPLLVIARGGDGLDRLRALEMGIGEFITLPVDPIEFAANVNAHLRRKRYCDGLRRNVQQSLEQSVRDSLTGMHNRRYLETHLEPLVAQNVARGRAVSLLVVDVDHFKAVNDTYGHDVGDEVLREVAGRISTTLPGIELCCRFGGEEFVAAFSGVDDIFTMLMAEQLRRRIAREPIPILTEAGPLSVTVSIGVATTLGPDDTSAALFKRADLALYRAKKEGRNRVVADA